jgi:CDP-glucose 4,6-dehydratase
MWGHEARWFCDESPQPHEAAHLKLEISKAKQKLEWAPRWSLDLALTHIIDWHKAYLRGADLREKTIAQIEEFSKKKPEVSQSETPE